MLLDYSLFRTHQNSQQEPRYHFAEVGKLIEADKGVKRQLQDFLPRI